MMSRLLRGAFFGILLGIILGMAVGGLTYRPQTDDSENTAVLSMQNSVSDEVIRFHIRANSDTVQDQLLKLEVKEYAMQIINPIMTNADSMEKAKELLMAKLPYLKSQLDAYLKKAGYDYDIEIYLTEENFPLKQYGDITFPAGTYQALRIDIGEKKGQNWWCVLYPSLCFFDATHAVLTDRGEDELKRLLSEKEYAQLMESNGVTNGYTDAGKNVVYFHSGLADWFRTQFIHN